MATKRAKRKSRKRSAKLDVPKENLTSKKIKIALISLIFSLIVFAGSWIGYEYFSVNSWFFENFCFVLAYISGFLALAFLIALLVFMAFEAFRKKQ